jgi:hypothetical protein
MEKNLNIFIKDETFTYSMMMEEYEYHNLVRQLNEKRINI